jgi:hypothetical protein
MSILTENCYTTNLAVVKYITTLNKIVTVMNFESIPVDHEVSCIIPRVPMGVTLANLRDPPLNLAPPPRLQDFLAIYLKNPKDGP